MKAVLYTRFSSDKQTASFSIEEQVRLCTQKATLEKYEIIKIFEDKAQSAKTLNRQGLADMLAFVTDKKNDIDALYIYDVSRLSRNQIDFSIIKRDLAANGVTIRSVNGIPNDTVEGDLAQDLLARISQYKNEIDAVKIRGGLYNRFKAGLALHPVKGYKWSTNADGRKTLVPDKTFLHYQDLWHKVREEKLTIKQAVAFANKYIPLANFKNDSMSRFLSNKLYYGILEYPKYLGEEVKGVHKPMIDEQTFLEVRTIIKGRSHMNTKIRTKVNPNYPLTKILLCPNCSGKITAAKSKGKREYFEYYFCRNRNTCKYNKQVGIVHKAFIKKLSKLVPTKEQMTFIKELMREKYQSRFNDLTISTKEIEKELDKLETNKQTLLDKLLAGVIEDGDYKSAKAKIEANILAKKTLISEKQLDRLDIETVLNFIEFYMKNIHKIWQKFPIEVKIALQSSTFPKGLYFDNGVCRTSELSPAFRLKEQFAAYTSGNVPRLRVELR